MIKLENWTDRFGIKWEMAMEDTVPFPKHNPLSDIERQLDEYSFPDPFGLAMNPDELSRYKKINRDKYLVAGSLTYFCFERAWALMGMENFLIAIIEFPEQVRFLLYEIAKYARGVFDRYLEIGVDAVGFSEDLGTQRALMMSNAQFKEFFIPVYEYAFENVLKEGKIINFHSCGCVEGIIKDLADIGVTILNPIQARANDLLKVKNEACGKMALAGGIDTHLILTGTPEDIKKEVIAVMDVLKPNGGYICGPDQGFPNFPKENMEMLWKTAKETGRYR
jgi:uroporphyrinogen decarboxylase